MPRATELTRRLGILHPIIQAPMGGASTVELAAAVCDADAFGFIAAAYLTPDEIAHATRALRSLTPRPFGVNLFAPVERTPLPADVTPALDQVAAAHRLLGLPPPRPPTTPVDLFEDQLAACLESDASVVSFTFGIPPESAIRGIATRGKLFVGTATTVAEARLLEEAGADAVVAQGSEAGAHRGSFAASFEASAIGTMALVPQMVDALAVPVIASGGIMDGRGVAAALALGPGAVQMGTAFLTCDETGIPAAYLESILAAGEHETVVTRAFSGRPARGIANRFVRVVDEAPDAILPYPYQNALTRPMRTAAAQQGSADFLSLWAGQGLRLARRQPAADLIARVVAETENVVERLATAEM
jgi:nitronate monooxygenase